MDAESFSGRMAHLLTGAAHGDFRLATSLLSGGYQFGRRVQPRCPYLLTYPVRVWIDEMGRERDRAINFERSGNQRVREFWPYISACGRDPQGSSRTPVALSRNGERGAGRKLGGNPCGMGEKREPPKV